MSAATPEQIAVYKNAAHRVIQDDGSVRYYRSITERFSPGMRLTDCCAAVSTYMEFAGNQELTCKACYYEVDFGQGDGDEVLNANGTITAHGNRSVTIQVGS